MVEVSCGWLLGRATAMPVQEVTNQVQVEPDHVYVIPPNTNLGIVDGRLTLRPRPKTRAPHRSIDAFLEALAADQRELAIGVILSGTATDGTVGLEAIKAEGGITFAQDDSARYDSMPRSAVAAGCVDVVLSPEDIAREIARIARHPQLARKQADGALRAANDRADTTAREDDETPLPSAGHGDLDAGGTRARREVVNTREPAGAQSEEEGFKKVLVLLRNHSGVDFSLYKSTTIQRRITRRLVLTKHDTLERYAEFLRGQSSELDALYSDVLISVTSFFRNPDGFDVLQRTVLPALLQQRDDQPLRFWVLGCSTGQEAYSLAMAFVEAADQLSQSADLLRAWIAEEGLSRLPLRAEVWWFPLPGLVRVHQQLHGAVRADRQEAQDLREESFPHAHVSAALERTAWQISHGGWRTGCHSADTRSRSRGRWGWRAGRTQRAARGRRIACW